MKVHLEGMGLQGTLLAHRLHEYGVAFTWHDIDAEHTAWKASTGAIYPADSTNHGPDREAYNVWGAWYENEKFEYQHLERSTGLVFCTKNPPHKGKYDVTSFSNGLSQGSQVSYHFNAQAFVPEMRQRYASVRISTVAATETVKRNGAPYIITHGWGARLDRAYWGWTRCVQLEYDSRFRNNAETGGWVERPAFYFRPNRYVMAYAYPIPGGPWYYAGSSIIVQKKTALKPLEMYEKYTRWKRNFEELGKGMVKVRAEGSFLQGWRPAAAPSDEAWVRKTGNIITLRPLWNSGIRHFPAQWQGVANLLGLIP